MPPEAQSEKGILRWMRFLHGKNRKEFEHMAGTDEYIQEAYDTLVQMSADEKSKWNMRHVKRRSGIISLR